MAGFHHFHPSQTFFFSPGFRVYGIYSHIPPEGIATTYKMVNFLLDDVANPYYEKCWFVNQSKRMVETRTSKELVIVLHSIDHSIVIKNWLDFRLNNIYIYILPWKSKGTTIYCMFFPQRQHSFSYFIHNSSKLGLFGLNGRLAWDFLGFYVHGFSPR